MNKWLALLLAALIALAAYVAAGPYLAVNGVRSAIKDQDTAALERHVDFPVLRSNLRAQVDDYLLRQAGAEMQRNVFGAIALQVAGGLAGGAVDALLTPAGIGAVLGGRSLWHRGSGAGIDRNDSYSHSAPHDPLEGARYRYESTSRFTATVDDRDGDPVVFVMSRDGLRWKLTDIRLPLFDAGPSSEAGNG
jgi:hypothetical protein